MIGFSGITGPGAAPTPGGGSGAGFLVNRRGALGLTPPTGLK